MAISRLAVSNPSANTDVLFYTGVRTILSSVIATNKSNAAASVKIWVVALDQQSTPSNHTYIAYDVPLPANETFESFRFPVLTGDSVYIRSNSANISFMLSGIDDTNITGVELADLQEELSLAKTLALLDI